MIYYTIHYENGKADEFESVCFNQLYHLYSRDKNKDTYPDRIEVKLPMNEGVTKEQVYFLENFTKHVVESLPFGSLDTSREEGYVHYETSLNKKPEILMTELYIARRVYEHPWMIHTHRILEEIYREIFFYPGEEEIFLERASLILISCLFKRLGLTFRVGDHGNPNHILVSNPFFTLYDLYDCQKMLLNSAKLQNQSQFSNNYREEQTYKNISQGFWCPNLKSTGLWAKPETQPILDFAAQYGGEGNSLNHHQMLQFVRALNQKMKEIDNEDRN